MPDRVEVQDVTCAAGVTASSPTEIAITNVVACRVVRVEIVIPAGHAGLTGLALGYGHNPVLPRTAGRFISGDDERLVYDLTNYPDGPQWQCFLINADTISHTWELRWELDELRAPAAGSISTPIDLPDIYGIASATVGVGG